MLFKIFHELSYNEQQQFLAECMAVKEPTRRTVPESSSSRHTTVEYSLPTEGRAEKMRVCQRQVINNLKVTKRRLTLLAKKIKFGDSIHDQRGTHQNRPRNVSLTEVQSVEEHIRSFPSQESHYSRHTNKALFLSPELNIKKMYDLFKERYSDSRVKLHTYRDIFNEKFQLKFGLPRSDTCKTCDRYYVQMAAASSAEEANKLQRDSDIHHRKAEKAYDTLSNDTNSAKENPALVVLCVDLQQVIFTPNLTHSDVYYQRQFSNYNFCIHNMGKNEATMCIWNESTGKRGAAEIVSCILQYIENNFVKLQPHEVRTLIIWSDRCVGQNNNWKMIALCHYLIALQYFTEVNQKFLVTGHSFLPCDRDFALIEKIKKNVHSPRP